ncbi:hypothetical protein CAL7716_096070 [Calothrix sp. PCC 7716]|nr:hypothetical protein CAL7716_096070 [Calothrix sp. PCC 7716]
MTIYTLLDFSNILLKTHHYKLESNQAESETSKGLRLNVGDKIYCVYFSSLAFGDDWYYLVNSIDYFDEEDEEKGKDDFYEPLLDDEDGYLHYVADIKNNTKTRSISHWVDDYDRPSLESFHVDINQAEEVANYLHRRRLLELDKEIASIDC